MDYATASQTWHRRTTKPSMLERAVKAVLMVIIVIGLGVVYFNGVQWFAHAVDHELMLQERM